MELINGINFAPFAVKGSFLAAEARESLIQMKERTGANWVILVPAGLQSTPQSEEIDFTGSGSLSYLELTEMIEFAHSLGLKVALKPTVNCANGIWRAFINFFDNDVPCEPKWSNWFLSHKKFQLHYAKLAQESGCEMFIAGCEMVMSERREKEWRELFQSLRAVYDGLLSYNCDKYQEDQVSWWDCVDVISSSGYYPLGDWERQLDRIDKVVQKYRKPFFFAETGCMSITGSSKIPNNWELTGDPNAAEQAEWYQEMLSACRRRPWIEGTALWDWPCKLYNLNETAADKGYSFYGKPAEAVIKRYYSLD